MIVAIKPRLDPILLSIVFPISVMDIVPEAKPTKMLARSSEMKAWTLNLRIRTRIRTIAAIRVAISLPVLASARTR
jgi:hypothetical protein